ncbi:MAG: ABC transporter permease subunit [Lachnospiraceae bacterium]|nr:ABC transporter permease subunit [Lachnospiraceae bacterium]
MRALIREEFYKIINRRIVRVCFGVLLLCIVLLFIVAGPGNERSRIETGTETRSDLETIRQETLSGLAAIERDRELAKGFEGELTDEKLKRMAEAGGMLEYYHNEESISNIPVNGNYLNIFLAENRLTNGEYQNLSDYATATEVLPLQQTAMGSLTEKPIYFAYIQGWRVLITIMSMVGILVSLLSIIALSPVFAEEYAIHTAPILLTTEHGKRKGIAAKMVAGILFSLGALGISLCITVVLCICCYGVQGLNCFAGMLDNTWSLTEGWYGSTSYYTIGEFLLLFVAVMAIGMVMLVAFTLFASAVARQVYEALMLGIVFFALPGVIWFYLVMGNAEPHTQEILYRILYCTPLYSCMNGAIHSAVSTPMLLLRAIIFLLVVLPSIWLAQTKYKNHQVA